MKFIKSLCTASSLVLAISAYAGESVNSSLSAAGISGINIENERGSIKVIGQDIDEVRVEGELEDNIEAFIFETSGNQIKLKVDAEDRNRVRNDEGSKLTVYIPKELRVDFQGVSSHFSAKNLVKSVEARTVSGEIYASDLREHIELESVSGDIKSERLEGKIRLSTVSGDIKDSDSAGRLMLKAISGNIDSKSQAREVGMSAISGEIDFDLGEVDELSIQVVSGDVEGKLALSDDGRVKMSAVSGDLELEFKAPVNADFKLTSSAGGRIINDLTSDKVLKAKYGPSSKIKFTAGKGTATVKGSVVSGRIRVSG